MRKLICAICMLVALGVQGQELNCTVTINSDKIEGSNKSIFETLKQTITEYMNNNRWTNMTFAEKEKIECTLMIIVDAMKDDLFICEMQLQSKRPVFNASYTTPLINFRDKDFVFTYQEYDRIEYQQNTFTNNLTAMLAYYVYLIIGHDCDSYQRLGGSPYFQACEDIVNACQSASMSAEELKGWKAFDSNRNRYALINNLQDEAFKKYREYYYEYHRLGLDMMAATVDNGYDSQGFAYFARDEPCAAGDLRGEYISGRQVGRVNEYLPEGNGQREERGVRDIDGY